MAPSLLRTLTGTSLSISRKFHKNQRFPMPIPLRNAQEAGIGNCIGVAKARPQHTKTASSVLRFASKILFVWRSQGCLYLIFCLMFTAFLFSMSVIGSIPATRIRGADVPRKVLILLYTSYKQQQDWGLGPGDTLFKQLNCPAQACSFTTDKGLMDDAPVVLFHIPELKTDLSPPARSRYREQAWVFFTQQSPAHSHQPPYLWQHLFNWSMTYHPEAEIHFPFGRIQHRPSQNPKNYLAIAKEERKMVAWLVNSCKTPSKREAYIERLKKVVPVDTFGECGDHECDEPEACLQMVGKSYKFYISFETSFCDEYVTEEFFKHAMLDVVPVVRGGANYSRITPQNSYINTQDFQSPEELGRYLSFLSSNPDEYTKYLEWKNYYVVEVTSHKDRTWCDLCERAHDVTGVKRRNNPYEFWFQGKSCWIPTDVIPGG